MKQRGVSTGAQGRGQKLCRNCALCKKYEVRIVVNSDAHYKTSLGTYSKSLKMLEEIGFPERLILNADAERFGEYVYEKRGIKLFD